MPMRGITKRVEGQILIVVISISAIVALLLSGVSILLGSAFSQSFSSANVSLDQNQAISAVNYLTAGLNEAVQTSNISSINWSSLNLAPYQDPVPLSPSYGTNGYEQTYLQQGGWSSFDATGNKVNCPTTGSSYSVGPCYFIKAKAYYTSNASSAYQSAPSLQSITAEVVEGRNCLPSTSSSAIFGESCQHISYYSSNIETSNYYNYLYFTNYETLAPKFYQGVVGSSDPNIVNGKDQCQQDNTSSSCVPVSYESDYLNSANSTAYGDSLNGAIRTNSKKVFTCVGATSTFNVPVIEATSSTPVDNLCLDTPSTTAATTVPPIPFPSSVSNLAQIAYPYWFPSGVSVEALGTGQIKLSFQIDPTTSYYNFFQNVLGSVMTSAGDTVTTTTTPTGKIAVNATIVPPPNGVIYSTGNISNLVGDLSGQLTVAANGDIDIASAPASAPGVGANLYYNCAYTSSTPVALPASCTDMLGVVAQGDISIGSASPSSQISPSITVDGALTALGTAPGSDSSGVGTIYAANWLGAQTNGQYACLASLSTSLGPEQNNFINLNGSLVSQYRGVFGEYNQSSVSGNNSSPCLMSGYYKNFNWDGRLAHQQPPYSYAPSSSVFAPLGVRHIFSLS